MANDFSNHQMLSGEELYSELHETNVIDLEAELDDEDQILSEAELNSANTLMNETSEPLATVGAFSGSAPSTQERQEGSAESDTDFPSVSVERFISSSSESQRAPDPSLRTTGRIEDTERVTEMGRMETMEQLGTFAESVITEPTLMSNTVLELTVDMGLEIFESIPVVAIKDLPEGYHDCPICQETFKIKEDSEDPVRLPCRHVVGKSCISKWLPNNSCPLCRADIYPPVVPDAQARTGDATEPALLVTLLALRHVGGTEGEDTVSSEARIRDLAAALERQGEDVALITSQRTALMEVRLQQIVTLENILGDLRSLSS